MRSLFLGLAFLALAPAVQAAEYKGRCSLSIEDAVYMNGEACQITVDADGNLRIADGDKFADVRIDDDTKATQGEGYWNGVRAESHAHEPLGALVRGDGHALPYCFHTPWDGAGRPARLVTLCAMPPAG